MMRAILLLAAALAANAGASAASLQDCRDAKDVGDVIQACIEFAESEPEIREKLAWAIYQNAAGRGQQPWTRESAETSFREVSYALSLQPELFPAEKLRAELNWMFGQKQQAMDDVLSAFEHLYEAVDSLTDEERMLSGFNFQRKLRALNGWHKQIYMTLRTLCINADAAGESFEHCDLMTLTIMSRALESYSTSHWDDIADVLAMESLDRALDYLNDLEQGIDLDPASINRKLGTKVIALYAAVGGSGTDGYDGQLVNVSNVDSKDRVAYPSSSHLKSIWHWKRQRLEDAGEYDRVLEVLNHAVENTPADWEYHWRGHRATFYVEHGNNPAAALADYDWLIKNKTEKGYKKIYMERREKALAMLRERG